MKKKKIIKEEKKLHRAVLWLGVLVIGTVVGISIQFGRAWVEPSGSAPDSENIAAPINTGASEQIKVGTETQKADICVDPKGNGDVKCLSNLVSFPACTLAGGVPVMVEGITLCKFPGDTCGAGWHKYPNDTLYYSETRANQCVGGGDCGTSTVSGFHSFAKIDPATETTTYTDGSKQQSCSQGGCIDNCGCWCKDNCCPCTCCCAYAQNCSWSCPSSPNKFCKSIIEFVGCVQ